MSAFSKKTTTKQKDKTNFILDESTKYEEIIPKKWDEIKRIEDTEDLFSSKATAAFKSIFRFSPKAVLTDRNGSIKDIENPRDWLEHGGAIGQCNNVIGGWRPDDECYICGLTFEDDDEKNSPECEHILPVIQASLLLTLYSGKQKPTYNPSTNKLYTTTHKKLIRDQENPHGRSIKNELELEYAWAHTCCNRVKDDDSFLTFDKKNGTFVLDVETTRMILGAVYDGRRKDKDPLQYCQTISGKLKNKYTGKNKREEWIIGRMDTINSEKIQPICKLLNKFKGSSQRLYYLALYANILSAADSELLSLKKTGKTEIIKVPITEALLKSKSYIEVSENIISQIEALSSIQKLSNNRYIFDLFLNNILYDNNGEPIITSNVTSVTDTSGKINFRKYYTFINDLLIAKIGKQNITKGLTDFSFKGILRDMMILIKQVLPDKNEADVGYIASECLKVSIYSYFLYSIQEFSKEKNYKTVFGIGVEPSRRQNELIDNFKTCINDIINLIKTSINICLDNIKTDGKDQYRTILSILIYLLQNNNLNANIDITYIVKDYNPVKISDIVNNMMEKRVGYYNKHADENDVYENEEDLKADISKLEFSAIQKLANFKKSKEFYKEYTREHKEEAKELEEEAKEEKKEEAKEEAEEIDAQEYIKEAVNALSALKIDVTGSPLTRREEKEKRKRSLEEEKFNEVEAAIGITKLQNQAQSQRSQLPPASPAARQSLRLKRTRTKRGGENKSKRKTRKIRRNISIRV